MSTKFSKKKKVINRGEYDMLRGMMTEEAFFDSFTVCEKLVTRIAAEEMITYIAFTDLSPLYTDQKNGSAELN